LTEEAGQNQQVHQRPAREESNVRKMNRAGFVWLAAVVITLVIGVGCATEHVDGGADAGPPSGDAARSPDAFAAPDASVEIDAAAPVTCMTRADACSREVYDRAVAYAAAHPLRDGASWSGWCGSLMMRFGGFGASAPTAIAAYHGSTIQSTDMTAAPIGAFHYWELGTAGHVGVDLLGGGSTVFMASRHLGDSWGTAIGVNSVGQYSIDAGARYLGWSMEYNGHGQRLAGGGDCGAVIVPSGCAIPLSPTEMTGVPDHAFTMRLQVYASEHGYTGPIDGQMDGMTWIGVQTALGGHGYGGPANGIPAANTYMAFQRLAAEHGYAGPVNGVLGPNSYRGFAAFLNAR
jgi:hypothetical protein